MSHAIGHGDPEKVRVGGIYIKGLVDDEKMMRVSNANFAVILGKLFDADNWDGVANKLGSELVHFDPSEVLTLIEGVADPDDYLRRLTGLCEQAKEMDHRIYFC